MRLLTIGTGRPQNQGRGAEAVDVKEGYKLKEGENVWAFFSFFKYSLLGKIMIVWVYVRYTEISKYYPELIIHFFRKSNPFCP